MGYLLEEWALVVKVWILVLGLELHLELESKQRRQTVVLLLDYSSKQLQASHLVDNLEVHAALEFRVDPVAEVKWLLQAVHQLLCVLSLKLLVGIGQGTTDLIDHKELDLEIRQRVLQFLFHFLQCSLILLNVDLCEVEILLHLVHDFVGNAGFKALDKCLAQLLPHVYAKVLRHCIQQLVEADDHRLIYSPVLGLRNEEDQDVGVAGYHEGEIL